MFFVSCKSLVCIVSFDREVAVRVSSMAILLMILLSWRDGVHLLTSSDFLSLLDVWSSMQIVTTPDIQPMRRNASIQSCETHFSLCLISVMLLTALKLVAPLRLLAEDLGLPYQLASAIALDLKVSSEHHFKTLQTTETSLLS